MHCLFQIRLDICVQFLFVEYSSLATLFVQAIRPGCLKLFLLFCFKAAMKRFCLLVALFFAQDSASDV